MTLSDLLQYRERVHELAQNGAHHMAKDIIARVVTDIDTSHQVLPDPVANLQLRIGTAVQNIQHQIQHMTQLIQQLDAEIHQGIVAHHPQYHAQSRRLYENQFRHYTANKILDTPLDLTSDQRSLLRSRIMAHSNWLDTGLMLRAGRDDLVESMSAMGILYLFDTHPDLLAPAVARFPEHHRDKYRDYHGTEPNDLQQLPPNQMRLIVALNFFNFLPLDRIHQYLMNLTKLLRPGGVILFTFNDCDHAVNVGFCERSWQCYHPGDEILALARALGLELRGRQWFDNGVSWMELGLPGKYRSLRGAPIVTKIHARSK
jgi:SAM-dependent methyltransferase